jgi:purine-binding chemotaxis protein CheW
MADTRQYCTFFLEGLLFGVEVDRVQEVILTDRVTPLPLDAPGIRGLINLRGQIVTAVDLREVAPGSWLLAPGVGVSGQEGVPAAGGSSRSQEPPLSLILRTGGGAVSLLIDDIGDVLDVSERVFERTPALPEGRVDRVDPPGGPRPAAGCGLDRALVAGAFHLDDSVLLALDVDGLVSALSGVRAEHDAARDESTPFAAGWPHALTEEEMARLASASHAEARRLIRAIRGDGEPRGDEGMRREIDEEMISSSPLPLSPHPLTGELLALAEEAVEEVVCGARCFGDRVLSHLDGCVSMAAASIRKVRSMLPDSTRV